MPKRICSFVKNGFLIFSCKIVIGGYNFYAVFLQKAFVMSGVVTITGKPVKFPNDNTIESMFITVLDHLLKFGTVIRFCSQRAIDSCFLRTAKK